jgi:para-nitrobenzyl esterase
MNKISIRYFSYVEGILIIVTISLAFGTHLRSQSIDSHNFSNDIVKTGDGLLQGIGTHTPGVTAFEGIPYAAPPVGKLRWQDPRPVDHWKGIRKADHFCANCMQSPEALQENPPHALRPSVWTKPFLIPANEPLSENCLFLNVWTPAHSVKQRLPVIVWIHGGGFQGGSGSVPIYNGEAMAAKGVVFVTINYRLGIFGFFANPGLSHESAHHSSGNYGLLDQIAALKWVQRNIAAFGGNPANITIDGQSAGSFSVNDLVASPLAHGLFQKAIGESGAGIIRDPMQHMDNLQTAEIKGQQWMGKLHITSLGDLRKMPADSLLKFGGSFNPIVDGYVLPDNIRDIFLQRKQNDVPTITGWNQDEGKAFAMFMPAPKATAFTKMANSTYGNEAADFLYYYPAGNDTMAASSNYELIRDLLFGIQNYSWALLQSQTGKAPVYLYYFRRKLPAATPQFGFYGAFHSSEIVYVLDNLGYLNRPWQKTDTLLANLMSTYWVNFASTGNPNGANLPEWPSFRQDQQRAMIFGNDSHAGEVPHEKAMNFLTAFFEKQ